MSKCLVQLVLVARPLLASQVGLGSPCTPPRPSTRTYTHTHKHTHSLLATPGLHNVCGSQEHEDLGADISKHGGAAYVYPQPQDSTTTKTSKSNYSESGHAMANYSEGGVQTFTSN